MAMCLQFVFILAMATRNKAAMNLDIKISVWRGRRREGERGEGKKRKGRRERVEKGKEEKGREGEEKLEGEGERVPGAHRKHDLGSKV